MQCISTAFFINGTESVDFQTQFPLQLYLNSTVTMACVSLTVRDDDLDEGPEDYLLELRTLDPEIADRVFFTSNQILVNIEDNDEGELNHSVFTYQHTNTHTVIILSK